MRKENVHHMYDLSTGSQTPYGSTKLGGRRSSKERVYVPRRNSNHNNTNSTNSNNTSNNHHNNSGDEMKNHDRPEASTKLGVVYSFGELSD